MPKIFGSSLLAIVLATILFYMVGFVIYGLLFSEQWLTYAGMTAEQATARSEALGPMMFVWGLLLTFAQVLGIALFLRKANVRSAGKGLIKGAMLATLFALPVMAYNWLYQGSSGNLLGLDYVHLLIGYSLAGAVLGFFRAKDKLET